MRALVLLCLALTSIACSPGYDDMQDPVIELDTTGSVRIPLLGTAEDGTTYRIEGATFEISGVAMVTLSDADAKNQEELSTPLPSGSYSLFLRPGFRVIAVKPDGTTSTAQAELLKNPQAFDVSNLENPSLELAFRIGGREVTFENGGAARMSRVDLAL